ncbi:MAG: hypothetical protein U0835_26820 [Isosphaeraceae bacterium]
MIYFVHQFKPRFNEHALLDDPEMLEAVTAINRQILDLAPVLNSPDVPDAAEVKSQNPDVPVSALVKRFEGSTYVFTVNLRNAATRVSVSLRGACGREGRGGSARDGRSSRPAADSKRSARSRFTCTGSGREVCRGPTRGNPQQEAPRSRWAARAFPSSTRLCS